MVQLPWASSIREFNSLCPNILLYWDAIQFAQPSAAAPVFDMGRSTPGRRHLQVQGAVGRASRCRCTGNISCSTPGELPNVSPANPKFQLAIALWQKLPLARHDCASAR